MTDPAARHFKGFSSRQQRAAGSKNGKAAVMVTDLSNLAVGITGGGSMGAGNTISDPPWGGAVGSPSEATSDLPYGPTHNDPELDLGTVTGHAHLVQAGDDAFAGHGFSYPDTEGDGWHGTRP